MKRLHHLLARLFLGGSILLATARAEPSPVTVRVEQVNTHDATKYKKTERRALNVFVANASQEALELKMKYVIFGRDVKSHEVVTVGQGEHPLSLKPLGSEKIETSSAAAVSEEEHKEKTKMIEASGSKIIGQGVQILRGDQVVAEAFDPPGIKEEWGKTSAATKPRSKK
jgi:hypothetical protein